MTRAFVIRIPDDVDLAGGQFAGRIEDVDTGREGRFMSVERFLAFIRSSADPIGGLGVSARDAKGENDVDV